MWRSVLLVEETGVVNPTTVYTITTAPYCIYVQYTPRVLPIRNLIGVAMRAVYFNLGITELFFLSFLSRFVCKCQLR